MAFKKKIQNRGPTAKLWVQYFYMVSIVKDFIRSERLGDWDGHLKAVKKCFLFSTLLDIFCMQNLLIYTCRICSN